MDVLPVARHPARASLFNFYCFHVDPDDIPIMSITAYPHYLCQNMYGCATYLTAQEGARWAQAVQNYRLPCNVDELVRYVSPFRHNYFFRASHNVWGAVHAAHWEVVESHHCLHNIDEQVHYDLFQLQDHNKDFRLNDGCSLQYRMGSLELA